ncbi:hypothetical protein GF374_01400 [Candidatus Woesearchaeota archaeon]|nr:hypothetical protein [Candidatus Woesearchaeota archaeon]
MAVEESSPELEAMINSIGKTFPDVEEDRPLILGLIDWAKEELQINQIPTNENDLQLFGRYIAEVLEPKGSNGQTKNYIHNIVTHYKLSKILYDLKSAA